MKARLPGIAEIEPQMKHGWNTERVTARQEPRPTGRAPVLRSSPATEGGKLRLIPIFAPPLPFRVPSVFHPWPEVFNVTI